MRTVLFDFHKFQLQLGSLGQGIYHGHFTKDVLHSLIQAAAFLVICRFYEIDTVM